MLTEQELASEAWQAVAEAAAERRVEALRQCVPRTVHPYCPHVPHPLQQAFLCLDDLEVFFGGAAGPGKSDGLLMAGLQYIDVPGYAGLILRRTRADLDWPGAILDRAKSWLRGTDARPQGSYQRTWVFPSGARLVFGYAQHYADVERQFFGSEWQYIGIDEVTQWEERSYEFLFSRLRKIDWSCRNCPGPLMRTPDGWRHKDPDPDLFPLEIPIETACGRPDPIPLPLSPDGLAVPDVPLRMRSASNPMGVGHQWVKRRLVDPKTRQPGAVFLPGLLKDNPSLNPGAYIASLSRMNPVQRARLLAGDWDVMDEGAMFMRHWFPIVDEAPADCDWVRMWDLASTEVKEGKDPDWTVGALVGLKAGIWYLKDIRRVRALPLHVERLIQQTAATDGLGVDILIEREPGSSGVITIDHYAREVVPGYSFDEYRPEGKKWERAKPMSSAAEAGNFRLVAGPWNVPFLDEAELFPFAGAHDDQIDACSAAMHCLVEGRVRIIA